MLFAAGAKPDASLKADGSSHCVGLLLMTVTSVIASQAATENAMRTKKVTRVITRGF